MVPGVLAFGSLARAFAVAINHLSFPDAPGRREHLFTSKSTTRPVARLVPAERPPREHVATLFRQMDALRQSLPMSKDKTSLQDLINHGRRF